MHYQLLVLWTVIATVLYIWCWIFTLWRNWWFTAVLAIPVCILGYTPWCMVWTPDFPTTATSALKFLASAAAVSALGMGPFILFCIRQNKDLEKAKQARANAAEELLRRLGA